MRRLFAALSLCLVASAAHASSLPPVNPGGSSGQVQYNNGGVFAGGSGLIFSGGALQQAFTSYTAGPVAYGLSSETNTGLGFSAATGGNLYLTLRGNISAVVNGDGTTHFAPAGISMGTSATASIDVQASRLAAGQLMLSDGTTATKFTVSESADSPTSRTNYADLTIDTSSVANTAVIGTHRGGTSTWGGLLEFSVLGTDELDYGVTASGKWSLAAPIVYGSMGSTTSSSLGTGAGLGLASGAAIGWTSSTLNNGDDTGLSRASAGVVAVGNGTQGDYSATVEAASYQASPAANSTGLTVSGGSITGSSTVAPGIKVTGTLNTTGNVDGAALFANITNTASGSGTELLDLQVGGTSIFSVSPTGYVTVNGSNTSTFQGNGYKLSQQSGAYEQSCFSVGDTTGNGCNYGQFEILSGAASRPTLGFNSGAAYLSTLGTGQLMLSDTTTATKLTVSESTDSPSSRTNYADLTIDTSSVSNAAVIGTNRGGTSTWGGNLEFQVLGSDVLDYDVTGSTVGWTVGGAMTLSQVSGFASAVGNAALAIKTAHAANGSNALYISNSNSTVLTQQYQNGPLYLGTESLTVNNQPVVSINSTWNGSGVQFTGIQENITNTLSASNSYLENLEVGGSSEFAVDVAGNVYDGGTEGVTCTGTPTSSFATKGGIVTHC